jgi:hypothetical protein
VPAIRFDVEFECDKGHWVGVTHDTAILTPDAHDRPPVIRTPSTCPHAGCGAALKPKHTRGKK